MPISNASRSVSRIERLSIFTLTALRPLFLVVQRVMLDISDNVLVLRALDQTTDQRAGENGVFAEIFEVAAIARLAREVNAAAKLHGRAVE